MGLTSVSVSVPGRAERLPAWAWLVAVVAAELLLLAGYFGVTGARPTTLRYALYPFVWMNVGVWAAIHVSAPTAVRPHRWAAAALAAAYFLALAYLSGLVGFEFTAASGHAHGHVVGFQFTPSAPGWGPRIAYAGEAFHLAFVPYRVVGYLSLSYLLYAALLDARASPLPGVLGVAACIGCAFPAVTPLLGGVVGGSAALTGTAAGYSVDLSTAAFLAGIALLYWRPGTR
ncbi:DUF7546 family protein [Halomarina litorea]|uniref:DUF7546 family protein n=1 Tax=Halomarina litorea TaxID=2961595 RepID=UPI0020C2FD53|nr:hypothetical protein [Halomarina sp. BCD28]